MEFGEKANPNSSGTTTNAQPQPTKDHRRSSSRYLKLSRLPSLQEVLDRRTRPPLDLFCFYIYLQRESSEDALDFWLDVQQHENLCKAYFKDVKRSGRTVEEDWPEFATYARTHGSYFSPVLSLDHEVTDGSHTASGARPTQSPTPVSPPVPVPDTPHPLHRTASGRERRDTESHPTSPITPGPGASGMLEFDRSPPSAGTISGATAVGSTTNTRAKASGRQSLPAAWGALTGVGTSRRKSRAPTVIARDKAIEKSALVESAERIYLRYLLPGAEREIYLPPSLRLTNFPVSSGTGTISPMIPDLFHAQKMYIFRALEQDAFPRFLRAKAFGNLTPLSAFVRLVVGLAVLWGAFVLAFSLIFLDWKPRLTRLWLILPFIVAFNFLLAAYYSLDPFLALFTQSETTPFTLIRVREGYIRKLLFLRALWIEAAAIFLTAIFVVIFTVVPGHRL